MVSTSISLHTVSLKVSFSQHTRLNILNIIVKWVLNSFDFKVYNVHTKHDFEHFKY